MSAVADRIAHFPRTRYQGSKRKLLPALADEFARLEFDTALDAFGGTGAVAYLLKSMGKAVTYNDAYRFNHVVGRALIANNATRLEPDVASALTRAAPDRTYDDVVARTFDGVFFPRRENRWIDRVVQNIDALAPGFRRDIARYALFQACLAKRPYNLFHRANLAMRTRDVPRSFGNKTTWETPFATHFLRAVDEANAAVFSNGRRNRATRRDAAATDGAADLVYIDPPYVNARGGGVDYLDYYHFLEGLCRYDAWPGLVDASRKHRPIRHAPSRWCDPTRIEDAFDDLFARCDAAHLVVSYRSEGTPSIPALRRLLRRHGRRVRTATRAYRYALSPNARVREALLVAPRPTR